MIIRRRLAPIEVMSGNAERTHQTSRLLLSRRTRAVRHVAPDRVIALRAFCNFLLKLSFDMWLALRSLGSINSPARCRLSWASKYQVSKRLKKNFHEMILRLVSQGWWCRAMMECKNRGLSLMKLSTVWVIHRANSRGVWLPDWQRLCWYHPWTRWGNKKRWSGTK